VPHADTLRNMTWPPRQPLPPYALKACPFCDHYTSHPLNVEGTGYECEHCTMSFAPGQGND